MRRIKHGETNPRGVWVAEVMGPNGELILQAVTSKKRRVGEEVVPLGANHIEAAERLMELLDNVEPDRRQILRAM